MTNVRIAWNNVWRKGALSTTGFTSENPGFPASDTQIDSPQQFWRSRYGTGSGNGCFVVGSVLYIYFDEGTVEYAAAIPIGIYNGLTLATAVAAAMNAVTGKSLTYACVYSETEAKFTISASGTFSLHWATYLRDLVWPVSSGPAVECAGAGASRLISPYYTSLSWAGRSSPASALRWTAPMPGTAAAILGFSSAADDTGAATYTGDYRRIHYPYESPGWCDLGTAQEVNFVALLNHNIPSGATIQLTGADDANGTNPVTVALTWYTGNIYQFITAQTKQWWHPEVYAPDSAASYVQVGTIVLGKYWEPSNSYSKDYEWAPVDFSEVEESDSLVGFAQEKPSPYTGAFAFSGLDDSSRAQAIALINECGVRHGFVMCFDSATPNGNSWFVRNEEVARPVYRHLGYHDWSLAVKEVL